MDTHATHKTRAIRNWLERRPQRRPHWHVHFTPTLASWINQVERFCWIKSPSDILAASNRFCLRTSQTLAIQVES